MDSIVYILPTSLILLAGVFAGMGLYVWRRRPGLAITPFTWMLVSIAIRSLGYGLEFLAPHLSGKLIAAWFGLLGIVSFPVFCLFFCAAFTGRNYLLTPKRQAALWIIPVGTILLALTNPYHHLIWKYVWISQLGIHSYLETEPGGWLSLNLAYGLVLFVLILVCLLYEIPKASIPLRSQVMIILASAALPWLGGIAYLFQISKIDLTSFLFLPTSLIILRSLLRYRLLDIIPMQPVMILNDLQDGILVIDNHHRILYLNLAAEKLLGVNLENAFGQPVASLRPQCADTFSRLSNQKEMYIEKTFLVDGQETMFEIRQKYINAKERGVSAPTSGYLVSFRDIHLKKQVEIDLERREAMLSAINMAAQQFLKTAAWEPNIPAFLERLGQVAAVSRAYVFQNYHGEEGSLYTSQTYEWFAPDVRNQMDDIQLRHIPVNQIGPPDWSEQLSQGNLITAITREIPLSEQQGLCKSGALSTLLVPVFVQGKWWGFLGLEDHVVERSWRKAEKDSLQSAADIFGAAELRARNEYMLRRRQRTLNMLNEVVHTALQVTDMQTMSDSLAKRLSEMLNADGCFLSAWDDVKHKATPFAGFGQYRDVYLSVQPEENEITITGSVIMAGHTIVIEDLKNTPYVSQRIIDMFPYRSVMAIPLIAGQKRLGSIMLAYKQPRRFQPEEISIGEQAASLIALALEKFKAVEAASKRAEESETLRRAGAVVAETLRSNEAINRILEQLSYVLPYDSASVQLLRENEIEIVGGRGWDEESMKKVMGMRFPVPGDNPNTIVIQTGQPYILNEARNRHEEFKRNPHSHIRSWLGVPLIVREQIIGLLAIDSIEPDHFRDDDLKMAVAFADQVAIALENARLFEEAQNMALTDSLTGLYNRRGLFEIGNLEFSRSRRSKRPFSVVMVDIDHFKRVNDLYGHAIGDQALQGLAGHLRSITRDFDIVGRYGGEEFVLLLSETNLESASGVAERLREVVEKMPIQTDVGGLRMTISLGVTEYASANTPSLETLIARADKALYLAKEKGRNRVEAGK